MCSTYMQRRGSGGKWTLLSHVFVRLDAMFAVTFFLLGIWLGSTVAATSLPPCNVVNYSALILSNADTVIQNCNFVRRSYFGTELSGTGSEALLENATITFINVSSLNILVVGAMRNVSISAHNCTTAAEFFPSSSSSNDTAMNIVSGYRNAITGCNALNLAVRVTQSNIPRGFAVSYCTVSNASFTFEHSNVSWATNEFYAETTRIIFFGDFTIATNITVMVTDVLFSVYATELALVSISESAVVRHFSCDISNVTIYVLPTRMELFALVDATLEHAAVTATNVTVVVQSALPASLISLSALVPVSKFIALFAFGFSTLVNVSMDVSGMVATGPINMFFGSNRSSCTGTHMRVAHSTCTFLGANSTTGKSDVRAFFIMDGSYFTASSFVVFHTSVHLGHTNDTNNMMSVLASMVESTLFEWSSCAYIGTEKGTGVVIARSSTVRDTTLRFREVMWSLFGTHMFVDQSTIRDLCVELSSSNWTMEAYNVDLPLMIGFRRSYVASTSVVFTNASAVVLRVLREHDASGLMIASESVLENVSVSFERMTTVLLDSSSVRTVSTGVLGLENNSTWTGGGMTMSNCRIVVLARVIASILMTANTAMHEVELLMSGAHVQVTATNCTDEAKANVTTALATLWAITTTLSAVQLGSLRNARLSIVNSSVALNSELGHQVNVSAVTSTLLVLNHSILENVTLDIAGQSRISSQQGLVMSTGKNWLRHTLRNTTFSIRDGSVVDILGHGPLMALFTLFAADLGKTTQIVIDNASLRLRALVPSLGSSLAKPQGFLCSIVLASPSYYEAPTVDGISPLDMGSIVLTITNRSSISIQFESDDNPLNYPNVSLSGVDFGDKTFGALILITNTSGMQFSGAPAIDKASQHTVAVELKVDTSSTVAVHGAHVESALFARGMNVSNATVAFSSRSRVDFAPYGRAVLTASLIIAQKCRIGMAMALVEDHSQVNISIASNAFGPLPCFDATLPNCSAAPATSFSDLERSIVLAMVAVEDTIAGSLKLYLTSSSVVHISLFGIPTVDGEFPLHLVSGVIGVASLARSVAESVAIVMSQRVEATVTCQDCAAIILGQSTSNISSASIFVFASSLAMSANESTPPQGIKTLESMLNEDDDMNIKGFCALFFYNRPVIRIGVTIVMQDGAVMFLTASVAAVLTALIGEGVANLTMTVASASALTMSSLGSAAGSIAARGLSVDSNVTIKNNSVVKMAVAGTVASGVSLQFFEVQENISAIIDILSNSTLEIATSQDGLNVSQANDDQIAIGSFVVLSSDEKRVKATTATRRSFRVMVDASRVTLSNNNSISTIGVVKVRMDQIELTVTSMSVVHVTGLTSHGGTNVLDFEPSDNMLHNFLGLTSVFFFTKARVDDALVIAVVDGSTVVLDSIVGIAFFLHLTPVVSFNLLVTCGPDGRSSQLMLNAAGDGDSLLATLVVAVQSNISTALVSVNGSEERNIVEQPSSISLTVSPSSFNASHVAVGSLLLNSTILDAFSVAVSGHGTFVIAAEAAISILVMGLDVIISGPVTVVAQRGGSISVRTSPHCPISTVDDDDAMDVGNLDPGSLTGLAAISTWSGGVLDVRGSFTVVVSSNASITIVAPMAVALVAARVITNVRGITASPDCYVLHVSNGALLSIQARAMSPILMVAVMMVFNMHIPLVTTKVEGPNAQIVVGITNASTINETNNYWRSVWKDRCLRRSTNENASSTTTIVTITTNATSISALAVAYLISGSSLGNVTIDVEDAGLFNMTTQNASTMIFLSRGSNVSRKVAHVRSHGMVVVHGIAQADPDLVFTAEDLKITDTPGLCVVDLMDQGGLNDAVGMHLHVATRGEFLVKCASAFMSVAAFNATLLPAGVTAGTLWCGEVFAEYQGRVRLLASGNPYSMQAALFVAAGSVLQHPRIRSENGGNVNITVVNDIHSDTADLYGSFLAAIILALNGSIFDVSVDIHNGGMVSLSSINGVTAAVYVYDGICVRSRVHLDGPGSSFLMEATSSSPPVNLLNSSSFSVTSLAGMAVWFFTTASPYMSGMSIVATNQSTITVAAPISSMVLVYASNCVRCSTVHDLNMNISSRSKLLLNVSSFGAVLLLSNVTVASCTITVGGGGAIVLSDQLAASSSGGLSSSSSSSPSLSIMLAVNGTVVDVMELHIATGGSVRILPTPVSNTTVAVVAAAGIDGLVTAGAALLLMITQGSHLRSGIVRVIGQPAIPGVPTDYSIVSNEGMSYVLVHGVLCTLLLCQECALGTVSVEVQGPTAALFIDALGMGLVAALANAKTVTGLSVDLRNGAAMRVSLPSSTATNLNNVLGVFFVNGNGKAVDKLNAVRLSLDGASEANISCRRCTMSGYVANGAFLDNASISIGGGSTMRLQCSLPLLSASLLEIMANPSVTSLMNSKDNALASLVTLSSNSTVQRLNVMVRGPRSSLYITAAAAAVVISSKSRISHASFEVSDDARVAMEGGAGYGSGTVGIFTIFFFLVDSTTVDCVTVEFNHANVTTNLAIGWSGSLFFIDGVNFIGCTEDNATALTLRITNGSHVSLVQQASSLDVFPFGSIPIPAKMNALYLSAPRSVSVSVSGITPSAAVDFVVDGDSSITISIPANSAVVAGFVLLVDGVDTSIRMHLGPTAALMTPSTGLLPSTTSAQSFVLRVQQCHNISGSTIQLLGRVPLLPEGAIVEFIGNPSASMSAQQAFNGVFVSLIAPRVDFISASSSTSFARSAFVRVLYATLYESSILIKNATTSYAQMTALIDACSCAEGSPSSASNVAGLSGVNVTVADSHVVSRDNPPVISIRSTAASGGGAGLRMTNNVFLSRNTFEYRTVGATGQSGVQSRTDTAGPLLLIDSPRPVSSDATEKCFNLVLDANSFHRHANVFNIRSNLTHPDTIESHCTSFLLGRGWVKYTLTPVNRPMVLPVLRQFPTSLWNNAICMWSESESWTATENETKTPTSTHTHAPTFTVSTTPSGTGRTKSATMSRRISPSRHTETITAELTTTETIIPPTPTISLFVARRPCPPVSISVQGGATSLTDKDFRTGSVTLNLTLPEGIRWWNRPWAYEGDTFFTFSVVGETRPQPQGFSRYMSEVPLWNLTKWKFSGSDTYDTITLEFPVAPHFDLLLAETVAVAFDARAIQFQCIGSLKATAQFQVVPASSSTLIDATISSSAVAAISVLGSIGLSAADNQLLVILAGTRCSTAVLGGTTGLSSYLLSPFINYGFDYMIVGNILLVFAVALLQNVAAAVYYAIFFRKLPGGPVPLSDREVSAATKEGDEPGPYHGPLTSKLDFVFQAWAKVQFPGLTYAVAVLLQQGTFLAAVKISFQGAKGSPATPVIALFYTVGFIYCFRRALQEPKRLLATRQIVPMLHRAALPEFQEYKEFKNAALQWRILNPLGRWGPREWTRMFGKYFGQMQPTYFHLGPYPAVLVILTTIVAIIPFDGVGCIIQFSILGLIPITAGVYVIIRRPHRIPAVSILCGILHMIAGVIAFITAYLSSSSENTTDVSIQLAQLALSTASSLLVVVRVIVTSRVFYCENFKWNKIPMTLKNLASATWNSLLADSGGDLTRGGIKREKRHRDKGNKPLLTLPTPPPSPPSSELSDDEEGEDAWRMRPPRALHLIHAEMTKVNQKMHPVQKNVNDILSLGYRPPHHVDQLARLNQLIQLAAAERRYVRLLRELKHNGGWMPASCFDEFDLR